MAWLLVGIVLAPITHWWIRRNKFWGARTIIAGLVFTPGLCVTAWVVWLCVTEYVEFARMNRWGLVYFLQGRGALRCLAVITVITSAYLGVCLLLEHFSRRVEIDKEREEKNLVVKAWRSLLAIQLVLMAVATYIYFYKSLGDAVGNDNIALVDKRLNWNLEGLGPNNGLIVWRGTPGLVRFPLLPVAVKNGNHDMVKLLVKYGAELNPRDWDEELWLPSGKYFKNPFYSAVKNHDVEMINLLIELGANPDRGLYVALMEHDRELAEFFLEKGASLEFALNVAKQKGYSQQLIDRVFSDQIPNVQAGAGK